MPITFPLALPTVGGPRQIAMRTRSAVGQTVSPFTGQRQVQVHAAQFWEADISPAPMVRADAELDELAAKNADALARVAAAAMKLNEIGPGVGDCKMG